MCSLITDENKRAITEAQEFEKTSKYNDLVCMKTLKGGVLKKTFEQALEKIKEIGTDQDVEFFKTMFENSKPKCCLPKGHKGKCMHQYDNFFSELFRNKVRDCSQAPGNDDIFFKNRTQRTFPIQITKDQYTKLNAKYRWKLNKVKMKAGVPLEFSATSYLIATAYFDFAAILMLQKGIEHTFPKDIEEKLIERSKEIIEEFKEQGIRIIGKDGYLCDAVNGWTIEPEWYRIQDISDDKGDLRQVQFGHVDPIRSDKYQTRGGNILPLTRSGNLLQSNSHVKDVFQTTIKGAYEHHTSWR